MFCFNHPIKMHNCATHGRKFHGWGCKRLKNFGTVGKRFKGGWCNSIGRLMAEVQLIETLCCSVSGEREKNYM